MREGIYGFENDECRFLSNFYMHPIRYGGVTYPSSEHAYQAAKMLDIHNKIRISECPTAAGAKKLGRSLPMKKWWDMIKRDIMKEILKIKFSDPSLRERLLATDNLYLEETNWWNDTFWGVCKGRGKNELGKILMEIRDDRH